MKKQKTKWAKALPWFICVAGLALLAFAVVMFVTQLNDYSKASDLYENTNEEYVISKTDEKIKSSEEVAKDTSSWKYLVDVDIAKLRETNEDIAGWIFFEAEDISYPVLYSGDNVRYLRKSYTGERLTAGSIFIEGSNNKDFSDAHTIIYGHNMNDLSMFGKLEYYVTKKDYLVNHEHFQIITETGKFRYKIIAYKIVENDSDVYTVFQNGSKEFVDFVENKVIAGSFMEGDYDVTSFDHVITLSTCFNDKRLVISAVRCDEYTF